MHAWINNRLNAATWRGFAFWLVSLFAFSAWAFTGDGAWTNALKTAGQTLPEMQPGFPPTEPLRTLSVLGDATPSYLTWQLLDLPYIFLNMMVTGTGLSLALRTLNWQTTPATLLLALPLIYGLCEFIENALLASFASGLLAPSEPPVLFQQLATTLKLTAGTLGIFLSIIGVVVALIILAARKLRS